MSTIAATEGAFREANSSQRDQAYSRLRRLLILQQTPEGKRLREAEWAEKLGVNRTALREAFAR
ncbi:MAG: GntR family transcriptional regulator, partial [Planctomycetes bacterium]|nr:GntR family transcriptional regulator [Planctomycetota bacterium]